MKNRKTIFAFVTFTIFIISLIFFIVILRSETEPSNSKNSNSFPTIKEWNGGSYRDTDIGFTINLPAEYKVEVKDQDTDNKTVNFIYKNIHSSNFATQTRVTFSKNIMSYCGGYGGLDNKFWETFAISKYPISFNLNGELVKSSDDLEEVSASAVFNKEIQKYERICTGFYFEDNSVFIGVEIKELDSEKFVKDKLIPLLESVKLN